MALRRERLEYQRRDARAAAARRPRQGAEADDRARCRSGSRSTSPRSGRSNTALTAEIADGWLPTLFSPEHVAEFRPLLEEGFARARRRQVVRRLRRRADRERDRQRRPRRGARRDAPLPRALRRRDGVARAELLQPSSCAATGSRTPRSAGAGPLPRGPQGGGGRGAARRADRRRLAVRAARRRARPARVFRDAGVGHADRVADGLDASRSGASSCGSSPSWPGDAPGRPRAARPAAPGDERRRSPRWSARATRPTARGRRAGWEPPPPGRELDRWRGRITDGSWWTRIAVEPAAASSGSSASRRRSSWRAAGARTGAGEPIPGRAHVSAVFTHPDRWREGIAAAMLAARRGRDARRRATARCSCGRPREAPARRFYEATGWRHDGREQWLAELSLPIVAYVKAL